MLAMVLSVILSAGAPAPLVPYVVFYGQVIQYPSRHADHWALAVPIGRSHAWLGATLVNHNAYPLVRWDLGQRERRN
jgi:hypothetical protein